MTQSDFISRARGSFLGLAVGDALGTTLEFATRDSRPALADMIGGGPFNLAAGEWTDDTSMALCLAESLASQHELDAHDLMRRFTRWREDGYNSHNGRCFDIGMTTGQAITRYARTNDPFSGSTDPQSSGNGGIMRLAPAPIAHANDRRQAIDVARQQSRTTHGSDLCLAGTDIMTHLLIDAFEERISDFSSDDLRDRLRLHAGNASREWSVDLPSWWVSDQPVPARDDIRSSGFVIHTLDAALWACLTGKAFEAALLLAVNLADDADTVGAVTGQIAGAVLGVSAIPDDWMTKLVWRDRIDSLSRQLAGVSTP